MTRMSHHLACWTVLLAAACAGCGGSPADKAGGGDRAKVTVLELASGDHQRDVGEFIEAVARISGGSLVVRERQRVHPDDPAYDRAIVADLRAGRVAMGKVSARAWDLVGVDTFEPLVAPFAITSVEQQERVLRSPLAREMLAGVERLGLQGIALLPGELRYPVGVSRDAIAPADFRDAVVGIRPSGMADAAFAALGGKADTISREVGFDGLDLAELDTQTLAGADGLVEARSLTANLPLWPRTQTIVMGRAAYDRLTGEQRATLAKAASAALAPASEAIAANSETGAAFLCGRRDFTLLRAAPADVAAIKRGVAPVLARLRTDAGTRAALEAIEEMRAGTDTLRCGNVQAPAQTETAPTPVDATWKADVTREAYFAAKPQTHEDHEANWGPLTMTFRKGRFTIESERSSGHVVRGSYVVRGHQLLMRPEGSLEDGAGETWRYSWSRYRGTLRLRRAASTIMPTALRAVPWTEVR